MSWPRIALIAVFLVVAACVSIFGSTEQLGAFKDIALVGIGVLAGLPINPKKLRGGSTSRVVIGAAMCLLTIPLTGCGAATSTTIDSAGVKQTNQPAQMSVIDASNPNGPKITANYNGVGATSLMQDENGNYLTTPGIGGVVTYDPTSGKIYIWSPKDGSIGEFSFTPKPDAGQAQIVIKDMTFNASAPLSQLVEGLRIVATAVAGMTQTEAEKTIKMMEAAGTITHDVAQLAMQIIVPYLPIGP